MLVVGRVGTALNPNQMPICSLTLPLARRDPIAGYATLGKKKCQGRYVGTIRAEGLECVTAVAKSYGVYHRILRSGAIRNAFAAVKTLS